MTHVDKITVDVKTRDATNAGTNGEVYLGLGGREFRLDQPGDQFKKGDNNHFVIGVGSNVENKSINDLPLIPPANGNSPEINDDIVTGTNPFPVYVRLDPKDDHDNDWNVESVRVSAFAGGGGGGGTPRTFVFPKASGIHTEGAIWLGRNSGLTLFLEQS
jgi:hypothetical protein